MLYQTPSIKKNYETAINQLLECFLTLFFRIVWFSVWKFETVLNMRWKEGKNNSAAFKLSFSNGMHIKECADLTVNNTSYFRVAASGTSVLDLPNIVPGYWCLKDHNTSHLSDKSCISIRTFKHVHFFSKNRSLCVCHFLFKTPFNAVAIEWNVNRSPVNHCDMPPSIYISIVDRWLGDGIVYGHVPEGVRQLICI